MSLHLLRMTRSSTWFTPLTMSCTPCCSRPPFYPTTTHQSDLSPLTPLCPLWCHSLLRPPSGLRVRLLPQPLCHRSPLAHPHSYQCVFLGYSSEHKGYQYLNLLMNRMLVCQHTIFDSSSFPLCHIPKFLFQNVNHFLTINSNFPNTSFILF
jgi:hypothetical protein